VWGSRRAGELAGANPWAADTLEWSASSPPAAYGFLHLPVVSGRYPLWMQAGSPPRVHGLRSDRREALVTGILDAEPDHRSELPGSTPWPFITALGTGVLFVVSIFTPWGVVIGGVCVGAALAGWYWPRVPFTEELAPEQPRRWQKALKPGQDSHEVATTSGPVRAAGPGELEVSHLPATVFGSRGTLWWGVMGMMAIEGTAFALLIVSYFYLRDRSLDWPPTPLSLRQSMPSAIATLVLIVSALPNYFSVQAAKRGALAPMRRNLIAVIALGMVFLGLRWYELQTLPFRWDTHAHGSLFWTLMLLHVVHTITSALETALMALVLFVGPVQEKHLVDVEANALYWYFVVLLGAALFAVLYLDPRVLAR
jgi:cytochrome c oxidase subunit I+III